MKNVYIQLVLTSQKLHNQTIIILILKATILTNSNQHFINAQILALIPLSIHFITLGSNL